MARSLVGGLVAHGTPAASIRVAEPVAELRRALHADFGVQVFDTATAAADGAGLWLLAVKPQAMRQLCSDLAALAQAQRPLVVSIAAGISTAQIDRWLGGTLAVIRAMPNTPALLGAGVTALWANAQADDAGRAHADALLATVGTTLWLYDESRMDAVTAVSGSGPAYVFLLAEAMQAAAHAEGLPESAARTLVLQTIAGAARMLVESDAPAAELRRRVTSPDGTTQAAVETFQAGGFQDLVATAIRNSTERGRQLSAANE